MVLAFYMHKLDARNAGHKRMSQDEWWTLHAHAASVTKRRRILKKPSATTKSAEEDEHKQDDEDKDEEEDNEDEAEEGEEEEGEEEEVEKTSEMEDSAVDAEDSCRSPN